MMNIPTKLLEQLQNYGTKIGKVTRNQIEKIKGIMKDPENRLDEIKKISLAASGLYTWIVSTVNFYEVHKKVEPLK